MTRRLKRLREFEISLDIKDDGFIRPPRDSQRNWLLNKALTEHVENLRALDALAARFAPGSDPVPLADRSQAALSDEEIMEDWQIPLMRELAIAVTGSHGHVLEIGFGRGISSGFIQDCGVLSHTIIECNDTVVERFNTWRELFTDRDIRLVHGKWQDVLEELGTYDGLFFHTYPLNQTEIMEQIADSTTFAEHFFPHAAAHLNDGGAFTYLSNEIDSLSRTHQRALFKHFRSIKLEVSEELQLPVDVRDAWWANTMAIVTATK